MASEKITELTPVPSVDGSEILPLAKGGLNYRTTIAAIKAWIGVATTAVSGLMSSADKQKLNGVEAGATANSPDSTLRDRASHTGTQPVSTIVGLSAVATSNNYADLGNLPDLSPAALGAADASHVGQGGLAAHPLATETTPGFMSGAEKAAISRISGDAPAYSYQAVAAAGTTQTGATLVNLGINRVTSATASTDDAVKLPAGVASGTVIVIKNATATSLQLFPPSGGQVNFQGADTAVSMASYATFRVLSIGNDLWDQL